MPSVSFDLTIGYAFLLLSSIAMSLVLYIWSQSRRRPLQERSREEVVIGFIRMGQEQPVSEEPLTTDALCHVLDDGTHAEGAEVRYDADTDTWHVQLPATVKKA
jgi:hypothetical protein